MDEYPKICIMLLTYAKSARSERAKYAEKTLRSTLDNLSYSGQLSVHIADDGSYDKHVDKLVQIAGGYASVKGVSWSNSHQRGYGANYNAATQVIHSEAALVLPLEDDWVLSKPLNLDPFAEALLTSPINCIRLGYLGFTQELCGGLGHVAGKTFLLFDPNSPEPHISAGHPRLETTEWERAIGPWVEGVDPGRTEFLWCTSPAARHGVAWDMDAPDGGWFHHVGTVQARTDQEASS